MITDRAEEESRRQQERLDNENEKILVKSMVRSKKAGQSFESWYFMACQPAIGILGGVSKKPQKHILEGVWARIKNPKKEPAFLTTRQQIIDHLDKTGFFDEVERIIKG